MILDTEHANAELFVALAKAQSEVETVGKDGTNTQNRYNYATAEAMIRAARGPLTKNGLSFVVSWQPEPVEAQPGDIGNQFVGATVTAHWLLAHSGGGYIRGTAEMDAICSRARPTDKAVAATLTYMHGFILRGLLNLDRAEEDEHAVDRREETNFSGRQRQQFDRNKQRAIDASGGRLKPASEMQQPAKPEPARGDDPNWEQWLTPPAEVEASEEPHVWYCQALKGLLAHCGARSVGHVRAVLAWLYPGDEQLDPTVVKRDAGLAQAVWAKLCDKSNEVPFTRIVGEAIRAQKAAEEAQTP